MDDCENLFTRFPSKRIGPSILTKDFNFNLSMYLEKSSNKPNFAFKYFHFHSSYAAVENVICESRSP